MEVLKKVELLIDVMQKVVGSLKKRMEAEERTVAHLSQTYGWGTSEVAQAHGRAMGVKDAVRDVDEILAGFVELRDLFLKVGEERFLLLAPGVLRNSSSNQVQRKQRVDE